MSSRYYDDRYGRYYGKDMPKPGIMSRMAEMVSDHPILSGALALMGLGGGIAGGLIYSHLPSAHLTRVARTRLEDELGGVPEIPEWQIEGSKFDFPEVRSKHNFKHPNSVVVKKAVDVQAERPEWANTISSTFAAAKAQANRRGTLTNDDSIVRYRSAESCHPAATSCSNSFNQWIQVSAGYRYTTTSISCHSVGKSTVCTPIILTHYEHVKMNIQEIGISGKAVEANPVAKGMVAALENSRLYALDHSDGIAIAKSRGVSTSMPEAPVVH